MKQVASQPSTVVMNAPWLAPAEQPDHALKLPNRRWPIRKILKRGTLILLAVLLASGGFLGWKFYENASKLTGDKNPLSLVASFTPSTLKETNGRINILVAGYSADDPGHAGADLTDSIMIVSINPTTKQADLISVPRDLYVNVPGNGYSKINAAYEEGQSENFSASGYANGGMGLLEETISQDFGVSFDYYALIDYTAFQDAVNAVGGVTVDINSTDPRGLYDSNTNLDLANGEQTLTGAQALDLARARGDGAITYGFSDGDFDRTQHQQQLLVALKDKASSASVISNPLRIGELADAVGNNVKTDVTIGDMETLYTKVKSISDSSITSVTLNSYNGQDLLTDYTTGDGESALIPATGLDDYTQIQSVISTLLGTTSTTTTD
jgi:LCP family protein required for cell wall assembly